VILRPHARAVFFRCGLTLLGLAAAAAPAGAGHGGSATVVTLAATDARRLLDEGRGALFVDLRPAAEFARGHVPGARSLPIRELPRRSGELPKGGAAILYCDCGALELRAAFQLLWDQGHRNLAVLEDTFLDWRERGYPVER